MKGVGGKKEVDVWRDIIGWGLLGLLACIPAAILVWALKQYADEIEAYRKDLDDWKREREEET